MRDLHDHHARDMMLDLTGERRDVPPVQPVACGPATSAHAGSCERMALGSRGEAAGGGGAGVGGGGSGDIVQATRRLISEREGLEVLSAHAIQQPSPYYAMVPLDGVMREINLPLEACLSIVSHAHTMLWDQAVAEMAAEVAAAGPLPLASPEPWAESDAEYRARLMRDRGELDCEFYSPRLGPPAISYYGVEAFEAAMSFRSLDEHGQFHGLPRARLVPAGTPQPRADEETKP